MNVRPTLTGLLWTLLASTAGPNLQAQATVKIVTPPNLPPATVGVRYTLTFQATGTTLPLSWDIDNSAAPPGFTVDDPTGILTGTPSVTGTYNFRVHVDALMGFENSVASDGEIVTLVVSQAGSGQVMPWALVFNGSIGGENPPSKVLTVVSASGSPAFTFTVDSATQGSAAPLWLLAGPPQSQSTPGRIAVSVDLSKAPTSAGSYNGRIRVAFAGAATTSDIPVTLILTTAPQQLSVSPTSLRFTKANLEQTILVRTSGGGGPIGIGAGAPGTNIISSVKLSAPQTPTLIRVTVKPTSPGAYRSSVSLGSTTLLTGPSSAGVPVSYYVPPAGPFLAEDQTGYRFLVRQGNGTSVKKTIRVLNLGDPGTTINWKATLLAGSDFLALGATSGTATPTQAAAIPLTVITAGAASKTPKGYYGLIQITDSASPSTPQFVVVVLDVEPASTPVAPDPISGGIFFAAVAQGPQPAVQTISVGVSSQSPVPVLAAASTSDGGTWLSVTPSSPSASSASLAQFGVSIASGLKAGIYRGELDLAIGTELRVVNITVVIAPAGTTLPSVSAAESPQMLLCRLVSHACRLFAHATRPHAGRDGRQFLHPRRVAGLARHATQRRLRIDSPQRNRSSELLRRRSASHAPWRRSIRTLFCNLATRIDSLTDRDHSHRGNFHPPRRDLSNQRERERQCYPRAIPGDQWTAAQPEPADRRTAGPWHSHAGLRNKPLDDQRLTRQCSVADQLQRRTGSDGRPQRAYLLRQPEPANHPGAERIIRPRGISGSHLRQTAPTLCRSRWTLCQWLPAWSPSPTVL